MLLGQGDTERELERDMRKRLSGHFPGGQHRVVAAHLCWAIRQAMYRELRRLRSVSRLKAL